MCANNVSDKLQKLEISPISCPPLNGATYLDMLTHILLPQLIQDGRLDTVYFQQDRAPCHYASDVRTYLHVYISLGGGLDAQLLDVGSTFP